MTRTKPHKSYAEPSRLDIQARFQEIGFEKAYSYDLVRDLANAYSHVKTGGIVSDSFVNFQEKMGEIPTDPEEKEAYDKRVKYHSNVQTFLNSVDFDSYSGGSPLQKAASIVTALSSQEGGEGGDEGEPLPIFQESSSDEIQEKTERMDEDVRLTLEANKDASKYIFNPDNKSPEVALASMSDEQRELLARLALLGDRGAIKSRKTSAVQTIKQMSEYSDIARISNLTAMGMPTFGYKFATKQLTVRKPKQSSKQLLVVLIDDSGSMDTTEKVKWVKALILDRCNAVCEGKAELYLVPFERCSCFSSTIKLSSKEEVKTFLKEQWGYFPSFHGGGTNIQRSLEETCEAITAKRIGKYELKGLDNPQIVIMNDGQDEVNPDQTPKYTSHAFILGEDNEDMEKMISNSGGVYERFL